MAKPTRPSYRKEANGAQVVSSNHSKTLFKMLVSRKLLVMPTDMRLGKGMCDPLT